MCEEMPKYRSHKEVHALKIIEIQSPELDEIQLVLEDSTVRTVSFNYVRKHNPQVGGYFVLYADGYQSWSPAAVFEEGYTRIGAG